MRLSKRILFLSVLLLVILLPAFAVKGENLLVNPGFEDLDADGLPSGWYTDAYDKREGISLFSVTADAYEDNVAAVVENFGENDARFAQNVKVKPDSIYRLSGWIRADQIVDSGRGANLSVSDLYDACSASVFDSEGEWTYVEMYGRTGKDQDTITVFARVGGYSGVSIGRAAFDSLSLVEVKSIPMDATPKVWYKEDKPAVIQNEAGDTAETVQPGFWPWLLAISALYVAAGVWAMRWTQAYGATDPILKQLDQRKQRPKPEMIFLFVGLLLAAVLRVMVAWSVEGYGVDVGCFRSWGYSIFTNGPQVFYGKDGDFALRNLEGANFCDYPPGYLYILGFGEYISRLTGLPQYFCHKLVPMSCDLLAAMLIGHMARKHGCKRWQAAVMTLFFALNPAVILNSAAWCQVDSVLCFCLLLVAYLAISGNWMMTLPVYMLSVLLKPQALMLGFLGLAAIFMELAKAMPRWEKRKKGGQIQNYLHFPNVWKQMGIGVLLSLALALMIVLPFSSNQSSVLWLVDLYGETLSSYPYATVNTTNLYYLAQGNWDSILQNADFRVTAFFTAVSAVWALCTFQRRKDRTITWREPLLVLLAITGSVLLLLGGIPLVNGSGEYLLTTGNPWHVYVNAEGDYVREFITASQGAWSMSVSPVLLLILGVLLLSAAAGVMVMLRRQLRLALQEKLHSGLIEPVMMAMFTLVFGCMMFLDVTWSTLGVVAMAMAFAVILPMFIRSGELKLLPLCGAILFVLLYVFGVKMHERYLFPALFLLAMAYAVRRDRRILWLMIGLSCTLLINEGIILDNDLRLDNGHVHTDPESVGLTYLVALVNVLLGIWSVWVCQRVCDGAPVTLTEAHDTPILPVRTYEKKPCTPFDLRCEGRVKWSWVDAVLIGVVTSVYSIVTLTTLGSTKAPQQPWKSTSAQEQVIIDLGQVYDDFSMLYFAQVSFKDFTVAVSDDCETWPEDRIYCAEMAEGQCFRWKYVVPSYTSEGKHVYPGVNTFAGVQKMDGRYVCITAQQVGLVLNELIFRDAEGRQIPATVLYALNANENSPLLSDPQHLLDEQDTLEGEPGWWNSTYFDEIYHARTAYEHLNGTTPYETSHPPLGKVIMSWFVGLFGMTPFGWRFAGALCGILMLPAMYLITRQLLRRRDMAFVAMTLMALDCMHFTQTRIATIDSFPVLFIILSYFFMLRFMQHDVIREKVTSLLPDLALSGFFMGCGMASKWIGVYAGVGLAALYFWTCLRQLRIGIECARIKRTCMECTPEQKEVLEARDRPAMRRVTTLCLWCLLFFVLVPVVIYLLSYIPYFEYRDVDSFSEYISLVIKAQESMLNYHSTPGLGMDHPFYSPWYEWPFMQRPMYYAMDAFMPEGWSYAIFCFGNPAVWYVGLAGIAYALYRWAKSHRYRVVGQNGTWHAIADTWDIAPAFVLIGMMAQFMPWVLVPRGTYIYHYFASIPFLILGTVLLLSRICKPGSRAGRNLLIVYLSICLLLFVLLFPYASGVSTPTEWLDFVRSYPWVDAYAYRTNSDFLDKLNEIMLAIPLFPHVYH